MNLQNNQSRCLDFGNLTIEEEMRVTSENQTFLYLTLKGDFDGFQEGTSGRIVDYILHDLPNKSHRILLNFNQVRLYSDMAPVLIRDLQKQLLRQGGSTIIVAPSRSVQWSLKQLREPFVNTEHEALKVFQEDAH